MNIQKLVKFLDEHPINRSKLARDLCLSPSGLDARLSGRVAFKDYDLIALKNALNLTNEQLLDFLDL